MTKQPTPSCRHLRSVALRIEDALRTAGTEERAVNEKRYLKSELKHLGTPVPVIRKTTKAALRQADLNLEAALELAEILWSKPVHERRVAAVEILSFQAEELDPSHAPLVERLIRESRTWALVDGLAVKVAGSLAERFGRFGKTLDRWARDDDFWVRRSALLALLVPLRRGEGDFERFSRYADAMLEEREFFIRKAIGWVLREVSKKDPERVARWLEPRMDRISRVTLREAVRYLPDAMASSGRR